MNPPGKPEMNISWFNGILKLLFLLLNLTPNTKTMPSLALNYLIEEEYNEEQEFFEVLGEIEVVEKWLD